MASTTGAHAPTSHPTDGPDHRDRPRRRSRRSQVVAATAVVLAVALAGACSSSSDDVVAAGPSTTANPESPAADNPTTSVTTAGPGTTVAVPTAPTTDPVPAASTSTSVTSVPPASSVPGPVTPDADLVAQVFWVRAPGDARVIDIPGYQDPTSGPLPLVVYGSVTNNGSRSVDRPTVTAAWLDAGGATVATFSAAVVQPGTTTAAVALGPGESGDVIIVVTDAAMAERLADLVPELTAAGS